MSDYLMCRIQSIVTGGQHVLVVAGAHGKPLFDLGVPRYTESSIELSANAHQLVFAIVLVWVRARVIALLGVGKMIWRTIWVTLPTIQYVHACHLHINV